MDEHNQVGKNFAWLSIAQFSVRLIGAAFYFFLSYRLREAGLGEYNFISSFVPLWFLFTDFGASSYLYREWAKQRTSKEEVTRDFNVLFSCCSVITLGVFASFIGVNFFINREVLFPMVIFFIAMYVAGYVHLTDLNLQANNIFKQTSVRQIIEKISVAVLGIILLLWHPQVYLLFVAILISQVLSILYYWYKSILIKFNFIWDWNRVFTLFKKGIPFMLIGLFTTIYAKIDMTMLRYMGGFSAVGLYGSAYKFLDISTLFSSLFAASAFPVLTSLYERYRMSKEFNEFFYRNLRIIFASSVLIAIFFIFTAPILFKIFFPSSFSPGILVLRILIISQVLVFFSLLFNNLLIVQNKEKKMLFIIVSSASLNIILNIHIFAN
jgi:O-antigen/teichoic acid export membrane protein